MTTLSAALLFFLILDPLGAIPFFLSLLKPLTPKRQRIVLIRELLIALAVLFIFLWAGKYVLQVCRTLSCALRGAERVTEALSHQLGIQPGETDASREFTLLEVECLGACDRAPVVGVNDDWHECQRPEDARALIDGLRTRGPAALTGCHLKVDQ